MDLHGNSLVSGCMPSRRTNSTFEQITLLRFLVAFLGEKKQAGWWDSSFLNSTGIRFLENPFPRTALSAAFFSAAEAARAVHDSKIGRVGVYHLFRFPAEQEDALQAASGKCVSADWQTEYCDRDLALAELKKIAQKEVTASAGPIQIGTASNLFKPSFLAEVAANYHAAFAKGTPAYPYFGS